MRIIIGAPGVEPIEAILLESAEGSGLFALAFGDGAKPPQAASVTATISAAKV
jgi:hypothetical protein